MKMNARSNAKTVQKRQPSLSRKKVMLWLGSSVFTVALMAAGIYYAFFKPSLRDAPPVKSEPQKIAGYLASSKFKELPLEDKISYVKQLETEQPRAVWRADIPQDDREKLRENLRPVMQEVMKERLDNFFKKSPEEQQQELAKMAEEWKARQGQQAQGGQRPPGGGQGGWGGGGRNNPARTKARFESTDSNSRAERVQIRKLMQQQRQNTPAPTPLR